MSLLHWLQACLVHWSIVLGFVASVYAVILHGATLAQIRKSLKRRSVEDLSVAVPVGSFTVFSLWILFGVSIHDPFIYLPDVFGVALGGVLIIVYAALKKGVTPLGLRLTVAGVGTVWVTWTVLCLSGILPQHVNLLGGLALVGSFAGHVSILMQIVKTVQRKSVDDIVAALPFGVLGSYTVWSLYGFSTHNLVLEISSTLGAGLTAILCVLYLKYRKTA